MVDILLIEDDMELSGLISAFLKKEGYTVHAAMDGESGLAFLAKEQAKLLLLDIMLPGKDGYQICQSVRARKNLPIIVISANQGDDPKILSLALGADDYLEKPFSVELLIAKVKSHLRRTYEMPEDSEIISSGNITLNLTAGEAYMDRQPLNLTAKEFELLRLFLKHRGKVLTKEWIFNTVWGAYSESDYATLTVHINKLRERIEKNPKKPVRILTVWGVGYRYENNQ